MKKKIVSLCLILALAAIVVISGSLAYFTDDDAKTNTFTVGNVAIDLCESFNTEAATDIVPGRDVQKEVYVTNTGTNPAFVRVHIAVPADMDARIRNGAAANNFLHFDMSDASMAKGFWSWNKTINGASYPGNNSDQWNVYTTTIDGKRYNVYVVTYMTALDAGAGTVHPAIRRVYLDKTVDGTVNADGTVTYVDSMLNKITMEADETFAVKIVAEAVQAEGFDGNAYAALNAGCGDPGAAGYQPKFDWSNVEESGK